MRRTNNKQTRNHRLLSIKQDKVEAYYISKRKKQKQKGSDLGMSMCAHTQASVRSLVVCVHILRVCVCMQKVCVRIYAINPNPKTQEHNRTKNFKSGNLACLKMEKECKPKLNKHVITQTNKENEGNENQNKKTKGKGTRILYLKKAKLLSFILTIPLSQSIHDQTMK